MPGQAWDDDDPADRARILSNLSSLLTGLRADAPARTVPSVAEVQRWHAACYEGCKLPVAGYAGHFRGDPAVPELMGYEVGVGARQPDGWPSRVGVFSPQVHGEVLQLLSRVGAGIARLDAILAPGSRPTEAAQLQAIASLAAVIHGEWIRIHPYANGNGRTARIWAAWVALRYGVPIFVSVKPRPDNIAYAVAAASSMGRPPDFRGDHSLALNLFTDMLVQVLRQ